MFIIAVYLHMSNAYDFNLPTERSLRGLPPASRGNLIPPPERSSRGGRKADVAISETATPAPRARSDEV